MIKEVKQQEESTKAKKDASGHIYQFIQDLEKLTVEARAILEGESSASEKEALSVTEEKVWVVHFVVWFLSVATSCSHVFFFFAHSHILNTMLVVCVFCLCQM